MSAPTTRAARSSLAASSSGPSPSDGAPSPATPQRTTKRRRLFAPNPPAAADPSAADHEGGVEGTSPNQEERDAALAASLSARLNDSTAQRARYSLRRRVAKADLEHHPDAVESGGDAATGQGDVGTTEATVPLATPAKRTRRASSTDSKSKTTKPKPKPSPKDPFSISPRKTDLKKNVILPALHRNDDDDGPQDGDGGAASGGAAAEGDGDSKGKKKAREPRNWRRTLEVLRRQRSRIVAPVDTMGCEENGREDRRADKFRAADGGADGGGSGESKEDAERRERFACLVSLMLSSQTKDPITAQAVYNLQLHLPDGLTVQSILDASDDDITRCIDKVGFWRRKTGYLKSAAKILKEDFDSDVPKTLDELLSIPGVGPKMAFLCLSGAWGIHAGIGVDVHVHRISNRLGWCKSNQPEQTRVQLEAFLPQPVQQDINRVLVGFGQVICVPVGPRCDLCDLATEKLCPSRRKVDAKAAASRRVKVELLPHADGDLKRDGDDVAESTTVAALKREATVAGLEGDVEEGGGVAVGSGGSGGAGASTSASVASALASTSAAGAPRVKVELEGPDGSGEVVLPQRSVTVDAATEETTPGATTGAAAEEEESSRPRRGSRRSGARVVPGRDDGEAPSVGVEAAAAAEESSSQEQLDAHVVARELGAELGTTTSTTAAAAADDDDDATAAAAAPRVARVKRERPSVSPLRGTPWAERSVAWRLTGRETR